MSQYNAFIDLFGQGEVVFIYYDDKHVAVDQETIKAIVSGPYRFSLGMHLLYNLNQANRYSFSVQNKGLTNVTVRWRGTTTDVTAGSNTIAFDFLNGTTFVPPATVSAPQFTAGNLVMISQP